MESNTEETIFSDQVANKRRLNLKTKCIKGAESTLACNNQNCDQYAFVCGNRNCECRAAHKKCLFTCTDQIIQLIEEKRAQSSDVIDKISQVLDKWIDDISKTRQQIEDILLDWGLSGPEKKFIEIIQKEDYKQLNGNHIHQITQQTMGYFSEEIKEKLFSQIQRVKQNYQAQIDTINKGVLSLFEKYQIPQKAVAFKEGLDVDFQSDYHLITELSKFREQELKKIGKLNVNDYNKTLNFIKSALKKDFESRLIKYKKNRRAYGSQKLREKYFEDYFLILSKGKDYIQKWQVDTEQLMKHLNKLLELELSQLSVFYRESDGILDKPFTSEMALSVQSTINAIYKVIDLIKTKGKEKIEFLVTSGKSLSDTFDIAMYFLDQVMDEHPEIDEIDVTWNCIRYGEKLKLEMQLLSDTINEVKSEIYHYELQA